MFKKISVLFIAVVAAIAFTGTAQAVSIVGGSGLLSSANATQLESWLGEGSIDITNIFTKIVGDGQTSTDFHAATDGMGRTFSVIEVLATQGNTHQIIGGYNPQSWSTIRDYNYSANLVDRTAFLFNLTSSTKLDQKINSNGQYQTFNLVEYGPTFGAGHDLYVNSTLSAGYAMEYSYGNGFGFNISNIIGKPYGGHTNSIDFGKIEVFTIAAASASVPEPSTLFLLGSGFVGLGFVRRKFKA